MTHGLPDAEAALAELVERMSGSVPHDAALVIYVDRKRIPARLPSTLNGLRVRYVVMDRLHVTRSYSAPFESRRHCIPHDLTHEPNSFDPEHIENSRSLELLIPQD